jgi:uncharacterized protein (UPF0212 family)
MKVTRSVTLDLRAAVFLDTLRNGKVSEYINRLILNEVDKKAVKRQLRHCHKCDLDTGQNYCPQCGDDVGLKE